MLNRPALISGTARPALRAAAHAAALVVLLALTLSLVPSDEAYYRVERVLSHIGPLGSASQHLRSLPGTMASVAREYFQERSLEVEGVDIDLDHAVRPLDDRYARQEWGWKASFGLEEMVDDFLNELRQHPQRYGY